MIKKISLYLMVTLYFFAGLNHFIRPESYKSMIPPYLSFHSVINYASGFLEIFLAFLLLIPAARAFSAGVIMLMLVAFLPVHIYMVQTGWCIQGKCLPEWMTWGRLLLQPLLIFWAWKVRQQAKIKGNKKGAESAP